MPSIIFSQDPKTYNHVRINNIVFFVAASGALCAEWSGHLQGHGIALFQLVDGSWVPQFHTYGNALDEVTNTYDRYVSSIIVGLGE